MPRPRVIGIVLIIISAFTAYLSITALFINSDVPDLMSVETGTYYALSLPLVIVSLGVMGTGFWIGWTILTLKVDTPMPEISKKRDSSKFKAFLLCTATVAGALLLLYGMYIRSYWALAIPAAAVTLTILGAVFWVGWAVLTARKTLNQ
jgi:hypothetical protein